MEADITIQMPEPKWECNKDGELPITCRVGEYITMITEELKGGCITYAVTWSNARGKWIVRFPNLPLAKWGAEVHARLLFLKSSKPRRRATRPALG